MDASLTLQFKEKFLNMREDLLIGIERVKLENEEVSPSAKNDLKDDADWTTQEAEEVLFYKLAGRSTFLLKKIDESLFKISRGSFGICEDCGQEISLSRLSARPMARLCLECKELEERSEIHIPYDRRSHTLGNLAPQVIAS
ncbi:MAG: TraR/DksA C4-type zinc finger protein [Bdellovibrio sp.]|nr:TraR/DksA C4-type zinc finger protein [Bdellovibrio sp.]